MKKALFSAFILLVIITFSGCFSNINEPLSLDEISESYDLEQAKKDGCVVFENLDVTAGQEIWASFTELAYAGKEASVRLYFYYTLDDPSRYDSEYYESIKGEYPKYFVLDLAYNGETYLIRHFENGNEIKEEYKYLMKYEGEPESSSASYKSYIRYVLVNDNTVSWEDIFYGTVSSDFRDQIPYQSVYIDLISD